MQREMRAQELLAELAELRQRIAELERSEAEHTLSEKKLKESEERFRTVADFTYDWEYWIGVDGDCLYVSPSCERITGYRPDEFEKEPRLLEMITHPDDRQALFHHIHEEFGREETISLDFRIITRGNEERWLGHICQPVYGSDGRYVGRRASNRDITNRKRAEEACQQSEERYRRITETITDYIFTVHVENGHPVETSHGPACKAVTGYGTEEFSADPTLWIRMVPEEHQATVREQASRILTDHDPQPIEHCIIHKDGHIRWVRNTPVCHFDVHGKLISYDGLIRDITEPKKAEEALRKSEERYRQLVETMNEGLAMADQNYILTFVNERFCEMLGYSRDEIIGHHIMEFVHDDYKEFMNDQMARRLKGKAESYEIDWRAKDGRRVYTLISPRGYYDKEGRFTGSLGVLTDITSRKRAEEELRKAHDELEIRVQQRTAELVEINEQLRREIEDRKRVEMELRDSETRYRLLINNLPSIVYRGYGDWSVDFMDEKIQTLIGYSKEEFNSRRKKWCDIVVGDDIASARGAFVAALKGDKSFVREYRIKTADDDILWIQDRGYILCDTAGEVEYVSGVFFDVTERKRLQKTLIQKEKLNTLGTIAAEVAHEIRNPLVSIGGFARRLQQKVRGLPECDIILHESQRLERILTRIRNYLKPVDIHYQECSVNIIIAECVTLLSPETEQKGIVCRLDLDRGLSLVYADPDILTQIFVNLILNAAEAIEKGEELFMRTFEGEQNLHIEFKNRTSRPHIKHPELFFMPFAEGGESIGLPLSYRLLQDMGGLLAFSQQEDYMVFTVSLPKRAKSS